MEKEAGPPSAEKHAFSRARSVKREGHWAFKITCEFSLQPHKASWENRGLLGLTRAVHAENSISEPVSPCA